MAFSSSGLGCALAYPGPCAVEARRPCSPSCRSSLLPHKQYERKTNMTSRADLDLQQVVTTDGKGTCVFDKNLLSPVQRPVDL